MANSGNVSLQVLGLPAMPPDWDEAKLTWSDVLNLKPLMRRDEVNSTRSNFIRCVCPQKQQPHSAAIQPTGDVSYGTKACSAVSS